MTTLLIQRERKGFTDSHSSSVAVAAEAAKHEAELRILYVVVAKLISCPICKKPLKSEFLVDNKEWVWRNTVRCEDKVHFNFCTLYKIYRHILKT